MERQRYLEIRKKINLKLNANHMYLHLVQDILLIAGVSFLLSNSSFLWRLPAIPLLSIFMFRHFSLMHEAVHGLIAKNKTVNDLVGVVSGCLCILPYHPWKQIHLEHHLWSGNLDKDPVMAIIRNCPKWPKPVQFVLSTFWQVWVPLLAILQYSVFWILSILQIFKPGNSSKNILSTTLPLIFWGAVLYSLPAQLSLTVLLPAAALYLLAVEVVNFPHHIGLVQYMGEAKIPVWQQYQTARSCTYPLWLARFVVLNFNYHTEHHMFPDAPWYQLENIHGLLKEELGEAYNVDSQFSWILKNRPKAITEMLLPEETTAAAPYKNAA